MKRTQTWEQKLAGHFKGVKVLPEIIEKALKVLNKPEASVNEVKKILCNDVSLSSRIIKIVNSAYFHLNTEITSLEHAITILGFNSVRNIILSATIGDIYKKNKSNAQFGLYCSEQWKHAVETANGAKFLAGLCSWRNDDFFTAGLLHDIGKVILVQYFPDALKEILTNHETGTDLRALESGVLGVDHCGVGSWVAEAWNFPKLIKSAIQYHHNPEEDTSFWEVNAIVHLADTFSHLLSVDIDLWGTKLSVNKNALGLLNITEADYPKIKTAMENIQLEVEAFFA